MAEATEQPDNAKAKADAIALAEQAEAEAAEAEALAVAARARARAIRLRREAQAQAEAAEAEAQAEAGQDADDAAESGQAEDSVTTHAADVAEESEPTEAPRRRLRIPNVSRFSSGLTAAAIVAICALLGASGWMLWQHHTVLAEQQRSADFIAAAKQEVINLTSLDFNNAKEGVQRILDNSTGVFRDDFQRRADDFASVVKDSKAVTHGSVVAAAVESMSKDSAVVLALANERITNLAGAKDDPRAFRFRVSVVREGDQLKISKVEFVL
jgi:Mce-associated membrane protein